jgi:hypothetical protein
VARKSSAEKTEVNAEVASSVQFDNPEDVQPINDSILEVDPKMLAETAQLPPKMDDPRWKSYVMSLFEPDELEDDRPKVAGLRRVVRKVIGPIVCGKAKVKQFPTLENGQRATAEYKVVILNKHMLDYDDQPYEMEFTDAADAWVHNIKGAEFALFPVANACTRAQVRALRNALSLDVAASEEMTDQPVEDAGLSGMITESQITKLDIKCQEFDIDLMKYINMGAIKYKKIDDVPYKKAIQMFSRLTDYQRKVKPIPEEITGYHSDWRGKA